MRREENRASTNFQIIPTFITEYENQLQYSVNASLCFVRYTGCKICLTLRMVKRCRFFIYKSLAIACIYNKTND